VQLKHVNAAWPFFLTHSFSISFLLKLLLRGPLYLSLQGSSWSIARQDFAPPGMVEVVMKQISYRGEIEVYDFVCFLC
jgi:hypothetical protein